jgi:hypothetical protein
VAVAAGGDPGLWARARVGPEGEVLVGGRVEGHEVGVPPARAAGVVGAERRRPSSSIHLLLTINYALK